MRIFFSEVCSRACAAGEEVHEDLLELALVGRHARQFGLKIDFHRDIPGAPSDRANLVADNRHATTRCRSGRHLRGSALRPVLRRNQFAADTETIIGLEPDPKMFLPGAAGALAAAEGSERTIRTVPSKII
jgi:hypothetical protein